MTERNFIVRAALLEETNNGWVWMQMADHSFPPRTIVRIERRVHERSFRIYAEVRRIDGNFRRIYKRDSMRIPLVENRDTIIMGEWYRDALAIPSTTCADNVTNTVRLDVASSRIRLWSSLRAACHHPDLVVRLGTRLGMVGVCLGFVGLWLGLLGLSPLPCLRYVTAVLAFISIIALPILAFVAGRGPRHSGVPK